jgi:hypothetical protein
MNSNRPDLVPTSIVDSRGRQTTVHKKPLDASSGASKAFPAPAIALSTEKRRESLVESILELAPRDNRLFLQLPIKSLKDEGSLLDVKRILEAPNFGSVNELTGVVNGVVSGETEPSVLKLLADKSDMLTPEFGFDQMYQLHIDLSVRYSKDRFNATPPTEEQFTAHLHVAARYDATRGLDKGDDTAMPNGPWSYYSNKELMDFVTRHPDKADVIIKHRETYLPEKNGFDQLEADLERLSALSNAVSDGWL